MKVYAVISWERYEGSYPPAKICSSLEEARRFVWDFEESNEDSDLGLSIYSYELDVDNSGEILML